MPNLNHNTTPTTSEHRELGTHGNVSGSSRHFSSSSGPLANNSSYSKNMPGSDVNAVENAYEADMSSSFQDLFYVAVNGMKQPTPTTVMSIAAVNSTQSPAGLVTDKTIAERTPNNSRTTVNSSVQNISGSSFYANDVTEKSIRLPSVQNTALVSSSTQLSTTVESTQVSTTSNLKLPTTNSPGNTGNQSDSPQHLLSPSVSSSSTQPRLTTTTAQQFSTLLTSSSSSATESTVGDTTGMSGDYTDELTDDITLSPAMQELFNVAVTGDDKQAATQQPPPAMSSTQLPSAGGLSRVARAAKTKQDRQRMQQWRDLTEKYKYNNTIIW
jgi:hypothetical protein